MSRVVSRVDVYGSSSALFDGMNREDFAEVDEEATVATYHDQIIAALQQAYPGAEVVLHDREERHPVVVTFDDGDIHNGAGGARDASTEARSIVDSVWDSQGFWVWLTPQEEQ